METGNFETLNSVTVKKRWWTQLSTGRRPTGTTLYSCSVLTIAGVLGRSSTIRKRCEIRITEYATVECTSA